MILFYHQNMRMWHREKSSGFFSITVKGTDWVECEECEEVEQEEEEEEENNLGEEEEKEVETLATEYDMKVRK